MDFKGTYTAIITPFNQKGSIDYTVFENLLEKQFYSEVSGIVVNGCTGEAPLLNGEETKELIYQTVRLSENKAKVIAGTGKNTTADTIAESLFAPAIGADAIMVITPSQTKPTQDGLFQHYMSVADAVEIPIMIYNIPGRTCAKMTSDTIARLSCHPNIVAIKEASQSVTIAQEIMSSCDITLLSGDDALALPLIALGAKGVVSVTANIIPVAVKQLVDYALSGDFVNARKTHFDLLPLFKALFVETNPIPVKAALEILGNASGTPRLPLLPATSKTYELLRLVMADLVIL